MNPKFLVTDNVPPGFLDGLAECGFDVVHIPVISNADLKETAAQYTGIVVNTSLIMNVEMLDAATQLKFILRPGSGLDNINLEECQRREILVLSSPEANSNAVGEHAIGILLALLNNIPKAVHEVKEGYWIRKDNTGEQLAGKTIGIIGYGNTGSAFARVLSGFNVRLLVYDKYLKDYGNTYIVEASLEDIYCDAQIISLHIPHTPETHHLINHEFIQNCQNPFYLVNTSRGKIVDTPALLHGLQSGKILGAALDVLENEKISSLSPEENKLMQDLVLMDNVVITPHIAGWNKQARELIFSLVLKKFRERIIK